MDAKSFALGKTVSRPRSLTALVPLQTGAVFTIPRLLGSTSTFALLDGSAAAARGLSAGTNVNLTLTGGDKLAATAALAAGASQSAAVEERSADGSATVARMVTLTGAYALAIAPGAPTMALSAAAGTQVATINGVPAGQSPTISPADGRFVIAGSEAAGWKIVRGLTAVSAGTVDISVSAPGATPATATVTVSDAVPTYKFASGRWRVPGVARAVSGSNVYLCQQFVMPAAGVDMTDPAFFMPGFWQGALGGSSPETSVGNTITIEGISIKIGSTWYAAPAGLFPITFDPAAVPGVLLPPITGVTMPADSMPTLRVAYNVPAGGSLPCQSRNPALGDAAQGSTTSLVAKLTDNSALSGANSHADAYAPMFCIGKTADALPVWAIFGDSIGYGANHSSVISAAYNGWTARAMFGYLACGLDDNTTSKRMSFSNFCVPGSRPQDITSRDSTFSKKKLDAIKTVYDTYGVWPFDKIIHQHGTNSVAGGVSVATLTGYLRTSINSIKSDSGKDVVQVEMIAKSTTTDGFATLGNLSVSAQDAYPGGVRWGTNANIGNNGVPDPTTALRADGTIQDSIAPWLTDSYDTASNRDKAPLSDWSTTLTAAAAQNAGSFSMTAAPTLGDYLNIAYTGGYADGHVSGVTGTGPYTVSMIMTSQIGASGAPNGATVRRQWRALDGTHPGRNEHLTKLVPSIVAWKQQHGWV